MALKFDTKEKFVVITPDETDLAAIMTEENLHTIREQIGQDPPHVVLNLKSLEHASPGCIELLAGLQAGFYEQNSSFVICEIPSPVLAEFKAHDAFDVMNITPTESEAWDIVQMEEIERELLG